MIQIAIIEDEINIHKEILQFVYEGIHQRKEIGVDIFSSAEEYLAVNQKYEMVLCQDLVQVKMRFSSS